MCLRYGTAQRNAGNGVEFGDGSVGDVPHSASSVSAVHRGALPEHSGWGGSDAWADSAREEEDGRNGRVVEENVRVGKESEVSFGWQMDILTPDGHSEVFV